MRYARQSAGWLEGLPVGNGRLAAMIWGSADTDVADLNHEWLWRGIHRNRKVTPAADGQIDIENASYIKCMTNIATSAFDLEGEINKYPADLTSFENKKAGHIKKFSGIMNRVTLDIAEGGEGGALDRLSIESGSPGISGTDTCIRATPVSLKTGVTALLRRRRNSWKTIWSKTKTAYFRLCRVSRRGRRRRRSRRSRFFRERR